MLKKIGAKKKHNVGYVNKVSVVSYNLYPVYMYHIRVLFKMKNFLFRIISKKGLKKDF